MKYLIVVPAALIFAAIGYMIGYIALDQERVQYFHNIAPTTTGKVIARRPEQHRTVIYQFQLDGIPFTGIGGESSISDSRDGVPIGTEVVVHYDPITPTNSMIGDPAILEQINNRIIAVLSLVMAIAAAVISGATILVYSKIKRARD